MARISNKDKALAYAAEHGIILTVEDDMSVFDPDSNTYTVEVWSLRAHLSETGSDCHTYFAHGTTEPRAWADALAYMERLTECADDCPCRDNGQDQDDTDRDQDQDTDQDRELVTQIQVKLHYTVPAILMANTRNIKVSRKTGLDGRQYVTLLSGQVKVYALGAWHTLTYDTQTMAFLYRSQYVSWIAGDTIVKLCAERPNDYAAVEWVE